MQTTSTEMCIRDGTESPSGSGETALDIMNQIPSFPESYTLSEAECVEVVHFAWGQYREYVGSLEAWGKSILKGLKRDTGTRRESHWVTQYRYFQEEMTIMGYWVFYNAYQASIDQIQGEKCKK